MKTYEATFMGRRRGAIGMLYQIYVHVQGRTESEAHNRLYDEYEHIHGLTLTEIGEGYCVPR